MNEDVVNLTRSVENQEHLQMAAPLPGRSGVDGGTYSCIFGFKQRLGYRADISERVTVQTTLGQPNDHYFMTGTNEFSPTIFTYAGEPLEVTLNELQTYASNTGNITQGTDPWKHFPWPEAIESEEKRINPEENYCQKYDC